jgi:N-acetylmuramoyl-L-alanine amidase
MPRIALLPSNHDNDPGSIANGTTEQKETKTIIFESEKILKINGIEVYVPPTNLALSEKIAWVNEYFTEDDFLFEIHLDTSENESESGISVFYEDGKEKEADFAEYFSNALAIRLRMKNRGIKADLQNQHGSFRILRETRPHAWAFRMGFLSCFKDLENFRKYGTQAIVDSVIDLFLPLNPFLQKENEWSFRDTPPSHFAFDALKKAKEKGIIQEDGFQNIRPNAGITRGEFFVILDRLGLLDSETT